MMKKEKKEFNKKTLIIIGVIVVLLLVGLILFFVLNDKDKVKTDDSEFTNIISLSVSDEVKAAKLIKENIVRVVNKVGEHEIVGTGFFLDNGYLLTNSHNVDIEGKITIEYYDGTIEEAKLYSNSIDMDIALLKVENPKVKYMNFINTDGLEVTNSVLAAGYAFNFKGEATITKGSISAMRDGEVLKYIQSDISMNRGCSGGPLFNDKAEIIGMNTFASDNGNIGISITSESIKDVVKMLLEEPKANYLTTTRPTNPINNLLINIGFTDDVKYELYGDTVIIKYVVEKDGGSLEENDSKLTYYCDEGYTLSGTLCIKEEKYSATKVEAKCPKGYELNSITRDGALACINFNWADGEKVYGCSDDEVRDGEDSIHYYDAEETPSYQTSYGVCPDGNCYDLGTMSIVYIRQLECSNKVNSASKYILSSEENIESNYKSFTSKTVSNYIKASNGAYEKGNINASNCVKEESGDVKIFYTKSELESMNVCNGSSIISAGSGYYCEEKISVTKYAYNTKCADSTLTLTYENKKLLCKGKKSWTSKARYDCKCPKGLEHSDRYHGEPQQFESGYNCEKACWKEEEKIVRHSYKCDGNDTLSGKDCIKRTFTNAKTK